MATYQLDMTATKRKRTPRGWPSFKLLPNKIPVTTGRHQCDFDVVEDEIPPADLPGYLQYKSLVFNAMGGNMRKPLGFYEYDLMRWGAVIESAGAEAGAQP